RFIRRADPPPTVLSPLSLHDALPIWIIRSWARMLTESRARGQRNRVCAKVEHWHIQYGAGCPRPALGVGCPARSGVASRAAPVRFPVPGCTIMAQKFVKATFTDTEDENTLPVLEGTLGPGAVDIQPLYNRFGIL